VNTRNETNVKCAILQLDYRQAAHLISLNLAFEPEALNSVKTVQYKTYGLPSQPHHSNDPLYRNKIIGESSKQFARSCWHTNIQD